jgi:hypothetical protein
MEITPSSTPYRLVVMTHLPRLPDNPISVYNTTRVSTFVPSLSCLVVCACIGSLSLLSCCLCLYRFPLLFSNRSFRSRIDLLAGISLLSRFCGQLSHIYVLGRDRSHNLSHFFPVLFKHKANTLFINSFAVPGCRSALTEKCIHRLSFSSWPLAWLPLVPWPDSKDQLPLRFLVAML